MRLVSRPPLFVLAIGLLGLILLLATLQYIWLGRISEAERERLRTTLASRTVEFAQDFDREVTRAYLLFQTEPPAPSRDASSSIAARYDRWNGTSAYPKLVKDLYTATPEPGGLKLQRFDHASRALVPADWPESMSDWRARLVDGSAPRPEPDDARPGLVIRRLPPPIWETVPALIVPSPMFVVDHRTGVPSFTPPEFSFTLLTLDVDYITRELFPLLAQRHFRKAGDVSEYQVAVVDVSRADSLVYQSTSAYRPDKADRADASATLFQVRTQDFGELAAEVRRFTTFTAATERIQQIERHGSLSARVGVRTPTQMSIVVQQGTATTETGRGSASLGRAAASAPRWQVVVKHPAGSLEAFVGTTRRRNLIVSTSILAVLAASMALLIVSTRRSQELARQQLEFVAAVSHELRTPLAVIRSAGDNLADGVVHDSAQIRKYGELVRAEGRRLSEMVEQILEFAGIQSGQRGFSRGSVSIQGVVDDVLSASQALIDEARMRVEIDIPADLTPVVGDESALRRVFQNLVGNAIKYGADGGWIGIRGRAAGAQVAVTVSDKGIGIPPAEQARIFEPFYRTADVIAARIQGAGLGLSLVQRIVDGHGGRITVKSAPGAGSEFTVTLPAAARGAAVAIPTARPGTEAPQSS
jgi:signal transduction histidine kinase